jgi:RHS repeat-associated protein
MEAAYGAGNRMLTHNGESLEYDLNGNLIQKGDVIFAWDARNRLVGVMGPGVEATFKYDAFNRRIEKTINGRTIRYLYDGWDVAQEIEGGMVTANYVRTLNIDEHLARIGYDDTVRYYHADALGSIIALTDGEGVVKTQYNYTPFGQPEVNGDASENPFMFTGREWDEGTGLYYYRLRYQSPMLGRFISEDPIGLAGGINMYAYVGNSPLNWRDSHGLSHVSINIVRESENALFTAGKIIVNVTQIGYTLELPWRENRRNVSRIPAGTYFGQVAYSGTFERDVIRILNVPGREDVEIHPGNFYSSTEGCPLVGKSVGGKGFVYDSAEALDEILDIINYAKQWDSYLGEQTDITINISDNF